MKRILSLIVIAAIVSFAIVSCKDDFNEEEFLRLQAELKSQADAERRSRDSAALYAESEAAAQSMIAALNASGDLMAVTFLFRENGNPVEGVNVTLTTGTKGEVTSGRVDAVLTGVSGADGTVVFENVTIGSGNAAFSKAGYVRTTANVDFGQPSPPLPVTTVVNGSSVTRYLPPVKRFEEAIIPMLSADASEGSVATISGTVTYENDVTNLTPEFPVGTVIRANLTNLLLGNPATFITSFAFADDSGLGTATVAANGRYSMTVPATAAGVNVSLIIPNIEGTSRMAVNGYDDGTGSAVTLAAGPEYRDVPTSWGPQAPLGFGTTIPAVVGARVVIPAAPAAGSGLKFDFTKVPKGITPGTFSSAELTDIGGNLYKIVNRGSYSDGPVPTVAISGGGGSGATAEANLRTYVSSLTVSNDGAGYVGSVNINIIVTDEDDNENFVGSITVPTNAGELPETINLADFALFLGFSSNNQVNIGSNVKSLSISVTGGGVPSTPAVVTGVFKTEVSSIQILTPGSGYTSAPTIEVSGGGSTNQAVIQVADFPFFWNIMPNNSETVDYPIMPNGITLHYAATPITAPQTSSNVNIFSTSGVNEGSSTLLSRLTLSNGDVIKKEEERVLRTTIMSSSAPTVTVSTVIPIDALRGIPSANIDLLTGSISSIAPLGSNGDGYNVPLTATIVPAIAGAPGSGAVVNLTGNSFDVATFEWSWAGTSTMTSRGTGYLRNLNQKGVQVATLPTTTAVQAGKEYTVDIVYGTGNRKVNVN